MKLLFGQGNALSDEEIGQLKAYDLLDAIAEFLSICVVAAIWCFFADTRSRDPEVYGLCAIMGVVSVLWHALAPSQYFGSSKLFLNNLLSAIFVTLIINVTGHQTSPFFFLYYLVLI